MGTELSWVNGYSTWRTTPTRSRHHESGVTSTVQSSTSRESATNSAQGPSSASGCAGTAALNASRRPGPSDANAVTRLESRPPEHIVPTGTSAINLACTDSRSVSSTSRSTAGEAAAESSFMRSGSTTDAGVYQRSDERMRVVVSTARLSPVVLARFRQSVSALRSPIRAGRSETASPERSRVECRRRAERRSHWQTTGLLDAPRDRGASRRSGPGRAATARGDRALRMQTGHSGGKSALTQGTRVRVRATQHRYLPCRHVEAGLLLARGG